MLARVFFLSLMVLALAAVGFVFLNLPQETQAPTAEAAPPPPKSGTAILVAARALQPGTLLRPEDVRWQDWTVGDVPEGFVERGHQKEEAIYGAVARRSFVVGEPLMQGQIVLPHERGFLAAVLTPGRRAVAVGVDAVTAASGLIWPGDHVDLLLSQTFDADTAAPSQRAVGETLLRDLRVLSIDQTLGDPKPDRIKGESTVPRTVTLEVSAKEAEKVAVASGLGRLMLALRSLGSEAEEQVAGEIWAGGESNSGASGPGAPKTGVGHFAPGPDSAIGAFASGAIVTGTWAGEVSPALASRHLPVGKAVQEGAGMLVVRGSQRAIQAKGS